MANPDGTVQVAPPTRSAFAPVAKQAPAKASASEATDANVNRSHENATDSDAAPAPEHVNKFLEGLKGMLGMKTHGIQEGGKDVNSAVDEAVKGVPGNSADY